METKAWYLEQRIKELSFEKEYYKKLVLYISNDCDVRYRLYQDKVDLLTDKISILTDELDKVKNEK